MGFPIAKSIAAGVIAGAAGAAVGAVYMDGYRDEVVSHIPDASRRERAIHYHDMAANTAMLGVQGLGYAIAYVGAHGDAPNAIAFGIGVMAASAGARLGWLAAQHVDLPF